jgi:SAM-dependent methyltransferase
VDDRPGRIVVEALAAGRRAWSGRLPERYYVDGRVRFRAALRDSLMPGARILDVGGGRAPFLAPGERPEGCRYTGLDVSGAELGRAGPGAYDETVATDVSTWSPELEQRFDLALSWQVLEHVRDVPAALENLRRYLVPGGRLVAMLSGRNSAFAALGRVTPHRIGAPLVARRMHRDADSVFPGVYDHCTHSELVRLLRRWHAGDVRPIWGGARYFGFARPVQAAYVAAEELARLTDRRQLATHYLIVATA